MKTKYKNLYTIITILTFTGCKNQSSHSNQSNISKKSINIRYHISNNLPFLDTTIIITSINNPQISNRDIPEKKAEASLYKYFKSKGVINQNELKGKLSNDEEKGCVKYDTVYQIHTNRFTGAIISYWLGECDLNGHCFQPSKAIIIDTKSGYKITNKDFIPTNFVIDSIIRSEIYGYDYECGGQGILRHFKITLK